ncbi:hypothetical protein FGB62_288g01 [Gracilaria domingensis]|nr:hypothetical protein FGB62_288g01 [Gracilaria domingensis]
MDARVDYMSTWKATKSSVAFIDDAGAERNVDQRAIARANIRGAHNRRASRPRQTAARARSASICAPAPAAAAPQNNGSIEMVVYWNAA